MDKEQIGTDATIHEHIKTIQEREYCVKERNLLKPTTLGLALITTYNELDLTLAKPNFRSKMEHEVTRIAENDLDRKVFVKDMIEIMKEVYK